MLGILSFELDWLNQAASWHLNSAGRLNMCDQRAGKMLGTDGELVGADTKIRERMCALLAMRKQVFQSKPVVDAFVLKKCLWAQPHFSVAGSVPPPPTRHEVGASHTHTHTQ